MPEICAYRLCLSDRIPGPMSRSVASASISNDLGSLHQVYHRCAPASILFLVASGMVGRRFVCGGLDGHAGPRLATRRAWCAPPDGVLAGTSSLAADGRSDDAALCSGCGAGDGCWQPLGEAAPGD